MSFLFLTCIVVHFTPSPRFLIIFQFLFCSSSSFFFFGKQFRLNLIRDEKVSCYTTSYTSVGLYYIFIIFIFHVFLFIYLFFYYLIFFLWFSFLFFPGYLQVDLLSCSRYVAAPFCLFSLNVWKQKKTEKKTLLIQEFCVCRLAPVTCMAVNQMFSHQAKGGRWAEWMGSGRLVSSSTCRHRFAAGTWPTWWVAAIWWASPCCAARFEKRRRIVSGWCGSLSNWSAAKVERTAARFSSRPSHRPWFCLGSMRPVLEFPFAPLGFSPCIE